MQDTQQSKRKQMTTTNNRMTENQPVTVVWRNMKNTDTCFKNQSKK